MENDPSIPSPQLVRWGPKDFLPAGITINRSDGKFIPWNELQEEIKKKLLVQVRIIPIGSNTILGDLYGRTDWIVKIVSKENVELGHIWFGVDPDENWKEDGLVRLGKPGKRTEIWQVFQRYSDNSYRRIKSYI